MTPQGNRTAGHGHDPVHAHDHGHDADAPYDHRHDPGDDHGDGDGHPYDHDHVHADGDGHTHGDGDDHGHGHNHAHGDGHDHGHDHHHGHGHAHGDGHGHTHGLVDPSIKRSRAGIRAVLISLAVLGATAVVQTVIYLATGSVALLADLIHNFGDALTAVPLGIAFLLRSERAERTAGLFVVGAIFISACVAGVEAVNKLIHQDAPTHLWALAAAGAVGYLGNLIAARVRTRAGRRLDSPALIADGKHAQADAYVSLGVIASAGAVAVGVPIADPLIGLAITLVILRITWDSWTTIRDGHAHPH